VNIQGGGRRARVEWDTSSLTQNGKNKKTSKPKKIKKTNQQLKGEERRRGGGGETVGKRSPGPTKKKEVEPLSWGGKKETGKLIRKSWNWGEKSNGTPGQRWGRVGRTQVGFSGKKPARRKKRRVSGTVLKKSSMLKGGD